MPSEAWLDQINKAVAEKVMGWTLEHRKQQTWDGTNTVSFWVDAKHNETYTQEGWRPTRDRAQAMQVFERCPWMRLEHNRPDGYSAGEASRWDSDHYDPYWSAHADTLMLAIQLAALKKAGVEVPSDQT